MAEIEIEEKYKDIFRIGVKGIIIWCNRYVSDTTSLMYFGYAHSLPNLLHALQENKSSTIRRKCQ